MNDVKTSHFISIFGGMSGFEPPEAQEKKKEVEEVRPTEENQGVDPDREHTREEAEGNAHRQKREPKPPKEEKPLHLLDIKV